MRDSLKNKSVLTYTFANGNGSIEVRWESFDYPERRHTYHVQIRTRPDFAWVETEIHSGSGDPVSLPKMLASVLGFLEAFSESRRNCNLYGENWNLFPAELADWAEAMGDEFAMAREEIEPTD